MVVWREKCKFVAESNQAHINMEKIKVTMKRQGVKMTSNREDVALAVKTYRLRSGETQAALGKRWGLSRWSIMKIEAAKPVSWELAYTAFARLSEDLEREKRKEEAL